MLTNTAPDLIFSAILEVEILFHVIYQETNNPGKLSKLFKIKHLFKLTYMFLSTDQIQYYTLNRLLAQQPGAQGQQVSGMHVITSTFLPHDGHR